MCHCSSGLAVQIYIDVLCAVFCVLLNSVAGDVADVHTVEVFDNEHCSSVYVTKCLCVR
jgi:hypothetical protein